MTASPDLWELQTLTDAATSGRGYFFTRITFKRRQHAEAVIEPLNYLLPTVVEWGEGFKIAIRAGVRPLTVQRLIDRVQAVFPDLAMDLFVPTDDECLVSDDD